MISRQTRLNRIYLASAALIPFALDVSVTLFCQPVSYWTGERKTALEDNPVAAYLLHVHPAAFVGGAVLYALLVCLLIYALPKSIAWWLALFLLLTHAGGARTWLWYLSNHYTLWAIAFDAAITSMAIFCFGKASRPATIRTAA